MAFGFMDSFFLSKNDKILLLSILFVAGDGLMVHAEQFRLRTNSDAEGDCHDYIGCFFCDIL